MQRRWGTSISETKNPTSTWLVGKNNIKIMKKIRYCLAAMTSFPL
jgi:hypothetical protein